VEVCVLNAPKHYAGLTDGPNDWLMVKEANAAEALRLFITKAAELTEIPTLAELMSPAHMLWVSWPEKTSPPFQGLE
jgi:hypothetical protein